MGKLKNTRILQDSQLSEIVTVFQGNGNYEKILSPKDTTKYIYKPRR